MRRGAGAGLPAAWRRACMHATCPHTPRRTFFSRTTSAAPLPPNPSHPTPAPPRPQGLLNKKPQDRLGWPQLLEHPFVRETEGERLAREKMLADAMEVAEGSRAWKVGRGWVGGARVAYSSPN